MTPGTLARCIYEPCVILARHPDARMGIAGELWPYELCLVIASVDRSRFYPVPNGEPLEMCLVMTLGKLEASGWILGRYLEEAP